MWRVTENFIDECTLNGRKPVPKSPDFNLVEFECREKITFRLLDDDGEIYFIGQMDSDQYNDYDDEGKGPFVPLDYFMYSYGCTEIQFKVFDKWETL